MYPNPFQDNVTINYDIQEQSDVSIGIYNLLGEQVYQKTTLNQASGKYNVQFGGKASRLPSGVYIVQLKIGQTFYTGRLVKMEN